MDEHDQVCNTIFELGLNQYGPIRDNLQKTKPVFFLDRSIPNHNSDAGITDSSLSLKFFGENEKERSKEEGDSSYSKNCSRKKLRLTRDQTTFLEDSFEQHSTLNTVRKQALAEKLNIKPRQVEVWFQNRRAWTKLKQTEINCKFLKKNCERLSEENLRLKKELLELRLAVKIEKPTPPVPPPPPYFFHIPEGAKLETCPSCENEIEKSRVAGGKPEEAAAAAVMEVVPEHKAGVVGGAK
ncbi:hypothetical protein Pfo_029554 [Paulownia fortunei]|nr:hypothetical protein Pfo_029554 [Paulownia fortunei]